MSGVGLASELKINSRVYTAFKQFMGTENQSEFFFQKSGGFLVYGGGGG